MSRNKKPLVNAAKYALEEFKEEVANEIGVNFKNDNSYKGDITAQQAGALANISNGKNIGGEMVKRMIQNAEEQMSKSEK